MSIGRPASERLITARQQNVSEVHHPVPVLNVVKTMLRPPGHHPRHIRALFLLTPDDQVAQRKLGHPRANLDNEVIVVAVSDEAIIIARGDPAILIARRDPAILIAQGDPATIIARGNQSNVGNQGSRVAPIVAIMPTIVTKCAE